MSLECSIDAMSVNKLRKIAHVGCAEFPFDANQAKAVLEMLKAAVRAWDAGLDPVAAARRAWIGPREGMTVGAWEAHYKNAERMLEGFRFS